MTPSRISRHFLQESVRFHIQDIGRQSIILAGILEENVWSCKILRKKFVNLGSNLEETA